METNVVFFGVAVAVIIVIASSYYLQQDATNQTSSSSPKSPSTTKNDSTKQESSKVGNGTSNKPNGETVAKVDRKVFLDKSRQVVKLHEKIHLSHDSRLFRFKLPDEHKESVLGLPVGKHFKLFAPNVHGHKADHWNHQPDAESASTKEEIERKYTPTSSDHDIGHFDLVIKVYKKETHPENDLSKVRFPDGGKMSQYLDSLNVGDELHLSGPWGINEYLGNGMFKFGAKPPKKFTSIGMIAGGTGLTPMYQVIKAILRDEADATVAHLLLANKTENDILMRKELEEMAEKHPKRFRLHYTLDAPPTDKEWKHHKGFVSAEMIEKTLPKASDETLVLLCGPPPMINFACKPNLEKLNYPKDNIKEF